MIEEQGYPSRNPFPSLGTFTIAGERRGFSSRVSRSIPRLPIINLGEMFESYLTGFRPEWSAEGKAVAVLGQHGSGKTHTIDAALKQVDSGTAPDIFPIYTLLQDDNFFDCYRQVVSRVNREPGLWKKLGQALLATMAAEQLSEELGSDVQEKLAPEEAERLFKNYTVGRSVTESRQEKALLDLTQSEFNKSLKLAIDALQGDKFDQAAAKWLSLETVTPEEMAAMGIKAPISTGDEGVAAILMLSALLTNAGFKVIFVIDQFEKAITRTETLIARRNEGYLRALIEGILVRNALLVLSGTEDGWEAVSPDIRGRVGQNVIHCPNLKLAEAYDLMRLYLTPPDLPFTPGRGSLFPFTENAVREILTLSSGNPRRVIQFSYEAFRNALPLRGMIDDADVRQIAKRIAGHYFNRSKVLADIKQILTFQPLQYTENLEIHGNYFDFGLLYGDGTPALLIHVTEAIFQDDEAANAFTTAATVSNLHASGIKVPLALIATGYVSPDIVDHLKKVVGKLVVYDPDTFKEELRGVVQEVVRQAGSFQKQPSENRDLEGKVQLLLQQLTKERTDHTVVIEKRGLELAETLVRERFVERLEKSRNDWNELRRELIEKIQAARKARRNEALEQVNRQIESAKMNWLVRDAVIGIVAVLAIYFWLTFGRYLHDDSRVLYLFTTYVATGSLCVLLLDLFIASRLPFSWSRISAPRDLNQFRGSYLLDQLGRLHASNPLFRLARYRRSFWHKIPTERLALIREAAFQNNKYIELTDELCTVPEFLIKVEENEKIPDCLFGALRKAAYVLAALKGYELRSDRNPDLSTDLAIGIGDRKGILFDLFNLGLDRLPLSNRPEMSERELREAVRFLSPLEEGGLGNYDFLSVIQTIDEMFLFCSQYLFYLERGVLRMPKSILP